MVVDIISNPSYFLPPLIGVATTLALIVVALVWSHRDFSTLIFCGLLTSIVLLNSLLFCMRASPDTYHALLWEKALIVPTIAIWVFYYHFTLVYTNNRGQRRILRACYLLLVIAALLSPTDLLVKGVRIEDYGYTPIVGVVSYFLVVPGPILMLAGARNMLKSYKLSSADRQRNRLLYVAIAAVFPIMGTIVDGFFNLPPVTIWCNLIFCILCTIAILKYNLLDIRVFIRKSSVYLVVSVVVAVPYVALLYATSRIFELKLAPWWLHALLILLLAVILRPIYGWAQRSIDRLFYRDRYDFFRALQQFGAQTQSLVNLKEIGSQMIQLVAGTLRASSACLLLPSEAKSDLVMLTSVGLENPPSRVVLKNINPLVQCLERSSGLLSSEQITAVSQLQTFSKKEKDNLERLQARLYIPIKTHESRLSALLVLGDKLGQQIYSSDDRQLLSTLANQIAIALENARLYEETKQSEKRLRHSERAYRELAESISDIFFAMNKELRYTYWNRASEEYTGISAKYALGKHFRDIFPDSEATKIAEEFYLKALKTREVQQFVSEYQLKGKDFVFEISAYPSKNGLSIFAKDITQRKQAELREKELQEELYRSSRLASIGELAAGVAHEINNPLTSIMGFAERALRRSIDERDKRDLGMLFEQAQRAAKVVENLRTFARRKKPNKEYSSINDILQKALEMRIYELRTSNIEVVTQFASAIPPIMVDYHQIQQVYLNIIMNAEQAMVDTNGRGKLVIKTSKVQDYIRTVFRDNGPGISAENLGKLFDPFFTTRGEKGGTGLGLSICHGIVAEHGGKIHAKSKQGKGATFFVELPLNTEEINKRVPLHSS